MVQRVHFLSDSMLKRLDTAFTSIDYKMYEAVIPMPGCLISKMSEMASINCRNSELIVMLAGINNLLNGFSVAHCMHSYQKTHLDIQNHCPQADIAFISISHVADNKFTGCDDSSEMNPLIDQLNKELKTFCHTKPNTYFIDIRQAMNSDIDGATVDRDNLAYDGLHFSRQGINIVAKDLKTQIEKIKHEIVNTSDSVDDATLDLNTEDIWPKLPAAALRNRVYPAMYHYVISR